MKIVVAGMRRAGSMWLFNVVRTLCATRADVNAFVQDRFSYKPGVAIPVVKVHKFEQAYLFAADLLITSHRDARDVAASAVMRGLCRPTNEAIAQYLLRTIAEEYQNWSAHAQYDMKYEDMQIDRLKVIKKLSELTQCTNIDAAAICRQVDAMPVGSANDTEVALLPRNYEDARSGIFKEVLNETLVKSIELVFAEYQSKHGY